MLTEGTELYDEVNAKMIKQLAIVKDLETAIKKMPKVTTPTTGTTGGGNIGKVTEATTKQAESQEEWNNALEYNIWLTGQAEDAFRSYADSITVSQDEAFGGDPEVNIQAQAEKYESIVNMATQASQTVVSIGNMVAQSAISDDAKELSSWRKKEQAKLNGLQVTGRRRAQMQAKLDKETEKREKELEKSRLKLRLANVWSSYAIGTAGALAQSFASAPPPIAIAMSATANALMLGTAIASSAQIASQMQGLYTGGVIGGKNATPTTSGGDDTMIMGKTGEYVLNASQQQELYNTLFNGGNGSGGGNTIHIENFSGGDSELAKLEDLLTELQANGRIKEVV